MLPSRKLLPVLALTLASCASVGSKNKAASSELDSASGAQAAAPQIDLAGPTALKGATYTFTQTAGRAFKIDVDKRTIRNCYSGIGYKVTKTAGGDYVVEISAMAVPAVVCSPAMQRDIAVGKTLTIPATSSYNSVRVHVFGNYRDVQNLKAETRAAAGIEVSKRREERTFTDYTFMQFQGKPITVDVDKKTIRACYASVGYQSTKLQGTPADYLVEVMPLMHPSVVCTPAMQRDIEVGFSFDAVADSGLTWGRAVIFGQLSAGVKPKAKLKTEGGSNDQALKSDADVKVLSADAWRDDMPVVGPAPADRTFVALKVEVNSYGCTKAEHFSTSVVQASEAQHILIKRTQPDICEATMHKVTLELTIREAGYKLGKKAMFNNQPQTVSEQIAH